MGSKFRVHFGRTVGDSIIDIVGFEPPVSWRTTATSRRLDVQLAGRITPATRGCRVTVHTALFPRGPLRLTRPVLNRIMQASWDKHPTAHQGDPGNGNLRRIRVSRAAGGLIIRA